MMTSLPTPNQTGQGSFAKSDLWCYFNLQSAVEGIRRGTRGSSGSHYRLLPMAYVEGGVVKSKRSIWRLSTITDFFRSIIDFIAVFFVTMFSMEKSDAYKKGSGSSKKWDGGPGGGGGPGRGPYGGGGPRGPRGMADLRSNDHSSLPACGSCCGG